MFDTVNPIAWLGCVLYLNRRTPDGALHRGHDPRRHPLGGFKCSFCGQAGAYLSEFVSHSADRMPDYITSADSLRSLKGK